jgi:hypothetical protein
MLRNDDGKNLKFPHNFFFFRREISSIPSLREVLLSKHEQEGQFDFDTDRSDKFAGHQSYREKKEGEAHPETKNSQGL